MLLAVVSVCRSCVLLAVFSVCSSCVLLAVLCVRPNVCSGGPSARSPGIPKESAGCNVLTTRVGAEEKQCSNHKGRSRGKAMFQPQGWEQRKSNVLTTRVGADEKHCSNSLHPEIGKNWPPRRASYRFTA